MACGFRNRAIAGRLAHRLLVSSFPRGKEPFGVVKDCMKPKEALASHEWETWDSGEADADL